jgi:hypothetical protein
MKISYVAIHSGTQISGEIDFDLCQIHPDGHDDPDARISEFRAGVIEWIAKKTVIDRNLLGNLGCSSDLGVIPDAEIQCRTFRMLQNALIYDVQKAPNYNIMKSQFDFGRLKFILTHLE